MSHPHAGVHVAVVLAAGGSSRLGRPKQLLTHAGETLLHRSVRLADATLPQRTLAIIGAHRAAMVAALDGEPCTIVDNHEWQHGLASSLQAAMHALHGHADPVLILGCDQPALEVSHLRALLDGAATSTAACAATRYGNARGIPAVVPATWLQQAAELQGDTGFGRRLRALSHAECFDLHAPELGCDVDTDADVAAAIAQGWLDADN